MNKMDQKIEIKNCINELCYKRFKTKNDIKKYLQKRFIDFKISLYYRNDELPGTDFSLIGTIENEEILCDFDLYYAKTRAREMYITETSYYFE